MRFIALLLLLASCAATIRAQDLPDKPKPHQAVFLSGVALLAAARTADAVTSRQVLDRGGWEANPLYGRHPSPARQAAINAAFFAGQTALFHFTEHSRRPWVRWAGRAALVAEIANQGRLAACSARMNTQSPRVQLCGTYF